MEEKEGSWQEKTNHTRLSAAEGANLFKVLAIIFIILGVVASLISQELIMMFVGVVCFILFLGISFILRAQDVIIKKLDEK